MIRLTEGPITEEPTVPKTQKKSDERRKYEAPEIVAEVALTELTLGMVSGGSSQLPPRRPRGRHRP